MAAEKTVNKRDEFAPLPVGVCMVPPRGQLFKWWQGPLVPCFYPTAAYPTDCAAALAVGEGKDG